MSNSMESEKRIDGEKKKKKHMCAQQTTIHRLQEYKYEYAKYFSEIDCIRISD